MSLGGKAVPGIRELSLKKHAESAENRLELCKDLGV